jgi:hypothetical protein
MHVSWRARGCKRAPLRRAFSLMARRQASLHWWCGLRACRHCGRRAGGRSMIGQVKRHQLWPARCADQLLSGGALTRRSDACGGGQAGRACAR